MSDSKITVEYIGKLEGHNGWVTTLAVGQDQTTNKTLLVSGSRDRSLIVWSLDLENPEPINTTESAEPVDWFVGKPFRALKGHSHFVSSISMSRDSKYVVSGSWDKTLRLWDLSTYKTKQIFIGHEKDVLSVAFSLDNRMIISGGMDKTLRYWNIKGENKHVNTDSKGWVSSMTHIKQGKESLLAVGSWDSKVRIVDSNLTVNRAIEAQDYAVVSMNSDEDGEYLFVGQKNGSIKIWNMAGEHNDSDTLKQTLDINADLNALSFENKYFTVLSLATSKGLSIREIKGNTELFSKAYGSNVQCLSLAWDQTKTYLFAGFSDGVIRVFKFSQQ